MINIMLTGVGGQGTVLAAKVLAQAAQHKGWHVRTAETIGMAQRGGSVVSHVRMGNEGEYVHAPLIALGSADLIIAFEPAEGARVLPYLSANGMLVTASTAIQPVTASLDASPYNGARVIRQLADAFSSSPERLTIVPDEALLSQLGTRKALNTVLLAQALSMGKVPLTIDDLRAAIRATVKPAFVDMNLEAINRAASLT